MKNLVIDEQFDQLPDDEKGRLIRNSDSVSFREQSKNILQYWRDNQPELIVIPNEYTKEDFLRDLKELLEKRSTRREVYNPITPEMDAIMLRMIEELPDGTYRIKTTKDEL